MTEGQCLVLCTALYISYSQGIRALGESGGGLRVNDPRLGRKLFGIRHHFPLQNLGTIIKTKFKLHKGSTSFTPPR